ncbi:multidrug effflux MFS transporter [Rhodococcus qingshengii]|uniref:multidrug effflux MFS transporter n=1 Tax=Rhodococcus qingshengii TaxID=334542 RepID=UPI0035DDD3C5
MIAPRGGARIRLVLLLGILTALGPFTVDMYLPALPQITQEFGTSDTMVQLTLTGTLLGLAFGQLLIGPLSDIYGRRRPLLVGTVIHVGASLACFFAPSIEVLTALRTLQGFGAAATGVIAMAIVRDLFTGHDAAVVLSRLMLVIGVAPILAPSIGGALMSVTQWRGVFLALFILGIAMIALAAVSLPETLPPENRSGKGIGAIARNYIALGKDAHFMVLVLVCGLGRGVLWSYIAASSYVMQEQFGLSATAYGFAFAGGAVVLIGSSQLNVVLLGRWSPNSITIWAMWGSSAVGAAFVVVAATDSWGFVGFAVPILLMLCATGFVMPNAPAVALSRHGEAAGSAAALIGFAQFGAAAVVAPVVGLLGNTSLAVAISMTGASVLGVIALLCVRR